MSVVQSYRASVFFIPVNGNLYPLPVTYPLTLSLPNNYNFPRPVGNVAIVNFSQSIRQPILEIPIVLRDADDGILSITGDFFNPAFLDYFITRGSVSSVIDLNDSPVMGTLILWDGLNSTYITNARAESFTLMATKSEGLMFIARFTGTFSETLYPGDDGWEDFTGYTFWDNSPLLSFQSVAINDSYGIFVGTPWKMSLTTNNNHVPDYMLANAQTGGFAVDIHAGTPTVNFQLIVQTDDSFIDAESVQDNPPFISVTIQGNFATCIFNILNPINLSRDSHSISNGRIFKSHSYASLGSFAQGYYQPPLTIYSSF